MTQEYEDLPVCPGCGARATIVDGGPIVEGIHLETAHAQDCSWMSDRRATLIVELPE
jgi:hypothetical protein